jgi:chorismate mutase-like protein
MNYTTELSGFRDEIDAIDRALVELIAKRFKVADRVIEVKRAKNIPAALPDRIEQVVQNNLRNAKDTKVPSQTIEKIWRTLISETIAYEERALGPSAKS